MPSKVNTDLKSELDFVAGTFFDFDVPVHQRWLLKYYTTDIERQFLKYYLVVRDHKRFAQHSGCPCRKEWAFGMKQRLLKLIKL